MCSTFVFQSNICGGAFNSSVFFLSVFTEMWVESICPINLPQFIFERYLPQFILERNERDIIRHT